MLQGEKQKMLQEESTKRIKGEKQKTIRFKKILAVLTLCVMIFPFQHAEAAGAEQKDIIINQNKNFGTHNTSPRSKKITYIVLHYVGATGTAKNNIDYYNQRTTTNASADFYVGFDGEIWQYNPDPEKRYCWSVGGYTQSGYASLYGIATNANSVSIEMCVRNKGNNKNANSPDWYFEQATIDSAVDLTKYLMDLYDVPAENVIRHFDVNGKYCPGVVGWNKASGSETAWNAFKNRIADKTAETTQSTQSGVPRYIQVTNIAANDVLNIRREPYAGAKKTGELKYNDPSIYTIVEIKDGWGKLKSGIGWINMYYTKEWKN